MSRVEPFAYSYWIRDSLMSIMLKDHNHDLIHSLSEKNDALWRYRREYQKNAQGCEHCQKLWEALEADDEKHVKMLSDEIKRHMDEGRFE